MSQPVSTRRRSFDWEQARRRLAAIADAAQAGGELSAADQQAELVRRAEELARTPPALVDEELIEVLQVRLAEQNFVVETAYVLEALRLTQATPLPGAAEFLVGVVNLRGEVLPVFDLRRFLGAFETRDARLEASRSGWTVVFGKDDAEFGWLVDELIGVETRHRGEFNKPPPPVGQVRSEYLRGVSPLDAAVWMDGQAILKDSRLYVEETDVP